MKLKELHIATVVMAITASAQAMTVFTDTFNYTVTNAFVAEGGWTTVIDTGDGMGSDAGSGLMWGNGGAGEAALEYNYAPTINVGEFITMDSNLNRPWGGYFYGMRIVLWDGADPGTRVEVAGGSLEGTSGTGGALPQVSYTVSAANITAGLDHVIFKYGHDANWGETNDVTFGVAVPEPSSMLLLSLGGLFLTTRRRR